MCETGSTNEAESVCGVLAGCVFPSSKKVTPSNRQVIGDDNRNSAGYAACACPRLFETPPTRAKFQPDSNDTTPVR